MNPETTSSSIEPSNTSAGSLLRRWLSDKIQSKPGYSLRAMARGLGVSPSFLSQVMSGRKKMTVDRAIQFSQVMKLDDATTRLLIHAAAQQTSNKDGGTNPSSVAKSLAPFKALEVEYFKALSQWFHIAILDLSETLGFLSEPDWIARRLKISSVQAADALERLKDLELLVETPQGLRKQESKISFSSSTSHAAIREYHKQMIEKAQEALNDARPEAFENRSITGATLSINREHLPEAYAAIDRFRQELQGLLSQGSCTEVFQLNIQLFNLSHPLTAQKNRSDS